MSPPPTNRRRQIVTLILTEQCNLSCSYCYETKHARSELSVDRAKDAISRAFQNKEYDELEIDFFGGEPLLKFGNIVEICEWLWSREWPVPYICFAITNGTLVHGRIERWVTKNSTRFMLGLSLDGTPQMHNINRCGSYEKINTEIFKKLWPSQSVKMTISRATLPNTAEGIIYLHELGFKVLCTYAFGIDWKLEDVDIFAEQMKELAGYYLAHPDVEPCNIISMPIKYILTGDRKKNYCGAGRSITCVDRHGDVYPCQTFLPMSTGKSREEMIEAFNFLQSPNNDSDEKCKLCCLLPICQTCYGINYSHSGNPFSRSEMNCKFSMVRAKASAYLLAEMIAHRDRGYACLSGASEADLYQMIGGIKEVSTNLLTRRSLNQIS